MLKTHGAFSRLRCAVTVNLTNRPHRDLDDAGKCFAIWVQKYVGGKPPKPPKQWWLLFPCVGLAIQLEHGVRISWNGRCAQHCSISVPGEEGDELLSLFSGTSLRVQGHKDDWASHKGERVVQGGKQLEVGDLVGVELSAGTCMSPQGETRLAEGVVAKLHEDGRAQVHVDSCSGGWRVVLGREQVVLKLK